MLTARRMRDRAEAEAAASPPRPVLPKELSRELHQRIVGDLNKTHAHELAAARKQAPATLVEIKFDEEPFKSAVEALVAELESKAKEALDAAAAEKAELQGKLDQALALVAELESKAKEALSPADPKGGKPKPR